jgi:hypothetical protein
LINLEKMRKVEPAAVIEDLKFTQHFLNDFSAVAIIGDKKWHKLMTDFSDFITEYNIEFYPVGQIKQAINWLETQ